MLKRILISFIIVLILLIAVTGFFRYHVNICEDYLLPEKGSITAKDIENASNKTIDYFFAGENKQYIGVIGKNTVENKYYYQFHSIDGGTIARGNFGSELDKFVIHDIRANLNSVSVLCMDKGVPVLYSIDFSVSGQGQIMKLEEKVRFNVSSITEKIKKLILPDENSEFVLATGSKKAYMFNMKGEMVRSYSYSDRSVITSGVLYNDILILCGADSASEDGAGFSFGFAAAFNANGESIWYTPIYDEINCISAVTECQINKDGNLAVYGNFYDYSQADIVMTTLETEMFEDIKSFGHGINYSIYTDKHKLNEDNTVKTSVFISEIDMEGNEKETKVYSALNDYRVPSISQEKSLNKLDANGDFVLTSAQTAGASEDTYFLSIGGIPSAVSDNVKVIYDVDLSGNVYAYITESGTGVYVLKHFVSTDSFAKGMEELARAIYVSELLDKVPGVLPWLLISVIAIILILAKHKWRDIDCD